ncbi:MAG: PucR family transcriptional regulator, partial [Nocardioides sp.]
MSITVRDIVDEPTLGARLVAGFDGTERIVTWAATCEMDTPWEWLDAGDLLLVNGHRIPEDPHKQSDFVAALASAGMSALGVAEHAFAPALSTEMLTKANDLTFPILRIDYEIAFVSISKYVAGGNRSHDQHNLRLVSRIYDRARHSSARKRDFVDTLLTIGELVGSRLSVATPTGHALLDTAEISEHLKAELQDEEERRRGHRLPAAIRLQNGPPGTLAIPLPAGRPALLIVEPLGNPCDVVVLTHIGMLIALELEREGTRHALMASVASDVMFRLVHRMVDTSVAAQTIKMLGFETEGEHVIAALQSPNDVDLIQMLVDHRVPHLICQNSHRSLIMLTHDDPSLSVLRSQALQRVIGLSAPFVGLRRVPDAAAEALFSLSTTDRPGLSAYGGENQVVRPRSLAEAQRLVDDVLGPLLDPRLGGKTDWVITLRTFLQSGRSWKRCSERMHLHKQTIVYRIKRIEELLGRSLDDMDDLAE